MKTFASVLVMAAASAFAANVGERMTQFASWTAQYGRSYASNEEAMHRFEIFRANADRIEAHNAKGLSWSMGLNEHADLTADEFGARFIGGFKYAGRQSNPVATHLLQKSVQAQAPASVDWSAKGELDLYL